METSLFQVQLDYKNAYTIFNQGLSAWHPGAFDSPHHPLSFDTSTLLVTLICAEIDLEASFSNWLLGYKRISILRTSYEALKAII